MPVDVAVPIDPSQGFSNLVNAWNAAYKAGALADGQGFWHAGNTLDAYVTYLVNAKEVDKADIVALSQKLFEDNWRNNDSKDPIGQPRWWRDDYGWWGMAFLNAVQNADALGIKPLVGELNHNANLCWRIMDTNWKARKYQGVMNTDDPALGGSTNTITNVLFLVLSLLRYQLSTYTDQDAFFAATGVFDWFYSAPPPEKGERGLYNSKSLIRYYPSHEEADRAWSGDQGWFLRACWDLVRLNPARKDQANDVINNLQPNAFTYLFDGDRIVHELPDLNGFNFDIDFATGIGVFMRQIAYVNMNMPGRQPRWADWIRKTAQGAADNSGWNDPVIPPQKSGGWDSSEDAQEYAKLWYPMLLWDMTRKTSALDAFAAYLTVGPG
jgi:hypothetical protein